MNLNVGLYARVSSEAQAGIDSVSISEQFTEMDRDCVERGDLAAKRYEDIGSGTTKNRTQFLQMLKDARDGVIDVILCWKSDRLARGIYPAAALLEAVESSGVELRSVTDHIDANTFAIFAAVGKMEIDSFRQRSAMGKRGAAKKGRWPVGNVPYGYRLSEDGTPEINESEAKYVSEIFDKYAIRDQGPREIARWLDESDAPRRRGSKHGHWFYTQVITMLSRSAYKGVGHYGKKSYRETEGGRRERARPREDWITVPFPALIDEATWDLAQLKKRSRSQFSKRNSNESHLLQGLLYCEECGLRFSVLIYRKNQVKRKDGSIYVREYKTPIRYYKCRGALDHSYTCRKQTHVRAEKLEELVFEKVTEILDDPLVLKGIMTEGAAVDDRADANSELAKAQQLLSEIELEENRLIQLYMKQKLTEKQLDHQRNNLFERKQVAHRLQNEAHERIQQQTADFGVDLDASAWSSSLRTDLEHLNSAEKQELVRMMLDSVSLNSENRVRMVVAVPLKVMSVDEKSTRSSRSPVIVLQG